MISFRKLKLINPIIRAVTEAGYSKPTEIQSRVIPMILAGKDIIASAPTGSGKKAAFVLPTLQILKKSSPEHKKIRALIVAPTIETAANIEENFRLCCKYSSVVVVNISDNVSIDNGFNTLQTRVDVLITTPDKLLDRLHRKLTDLSKLEILALYEADKLYVKNLLKDIKHIFKLFPKNVQTLFLGTEIPDYLKKISAKFQNNPCEIILDAGSQLLNTIEQSVYFVETRDKPELLIDLFYNNSVKRLLVFTDTKHIANHLVAHLETAGIRTAAIHAKLSQTERSDNLEGFINNTIKILVTTDIASKDFDIEELLDVVQYDLPEIPETYVRRIERAGKTGNKGTSVSFCTADEHSSLRNIQNLLGFTIPVTIFKNKL